MHPELSEFRFTIVHASSREVLATLASLKRAEEVASHFSFHQIWLLHVLEDGIFRSAWENGWRVLSDGRGVVSSRTFKPKEVPQGLRVGDLPPRSEPPGLVVEDRPDRSAAPLPKIESPPPSKPTARPSGFAATGATTGQGTPPAAFFLSFPTPLGQEKPETQNIERT